MIRRLIVICTLLIVSAMALAGCGGTQPTPTLTSPTATVEPAAQDQDQAQVVVPKAALLTDYVDSDPALLHSTGRPQMLEFFAHWCTDCQHMRPYIHELEDQYGQKIDFIYLNIDAPNTKDVQRTYGFNNIRPLLIFFTSDGNENGRLIGVTTKDNIEAQLQGLLAAG